MCVQNWNSALQNSIDNKSIPLRIENLGDLHSKALQQHWWGPITASEKLFKSKTLKFFLIPYLFSVTKMISRAILRNCNCRTDTNIKLHQKMFSSFPWHINIFKKVDDADLYLSWIQQCENSWGYIWESVYIL